MLDIIAGDVKVVGDIRRDGGSGEEPGPESGSESAQKDQPKNREQQK
jgi:hypothetical protein